jgi:hypothetical protein
MPLGVAPRGEKGWWYLMSTHSRHVCTVTLRWALAIYLVLGTFCMFPIGPVSAQGLVTDSIIRYVAQFGGYNYAVALQGNVAYVSTGPKLLIWDLADPAHPAELGSLVFKGVIQAIAVTGSRAYVAPRGGAVQILDISDPAHLAVIGSFAPASLVRHITIAGARAFLALDTEGLQIWGITDAGHPALLGSAVVPGRTVDVQLAANYAYVVSEDSGLHVLDINDPANIVDKGTFSGGHGIYLAGQRAYLAADNFGLSILDISDPLHPTEIGSTGWQVNTIVKSVFVVGNTAYVGTRGVGLQVVDVTDPTKPTVRGVCNSVFDPVAVQSDGSLACVATVDQGPQVIDVTNPIRPKLAYVPAAPSAPRSVTIAGNYAYLTDYGAGMRVIDITNPEQPRQVYTYWPSGNWGYRSPTGVALSGRYAYVACFDTGLHIVDITDPTQPVEIGNWDGDWDHLNDVAVAGNLVCLADDGGAVSIVDVSDPTQPTKVTAVSCDNRSALAVCMAGQHAYVAGSSGMTVIDLSNPAQTTVVGACDSWAFGLDVNNQHAYLARGTQGFAVVDVSNPTTPTQVASLALPGNAFAVRISGHYAYVACGLAGVIAVDISDPLHPVIAGSYDTTGGVSTSNFMYGGGAEGLDVTGSLVYVANVDNGLFTLAFTPSVQSTILTSGGSLTSPADHTEYVFPAGTFGQTVTVTHTMRPASSLTGLGGLVFAGHVFSVSAADGEGNPAALAPGKSYTVAVQYTDAERGVASAGTLALYSWDGSAWVKEASSSVDTAARTVTAQPDHLGTFALLGETRRLYLPFALKYFHRP